MHNTIATTPANGERVAAKRASLDSSSRNSSFRIKDESSSRSNSHSKIHQRDSSQHSRAI